MQYRRYSSKLLWILLVKKWCEYLHYVTFKLSKVFDHKWLPIGQGNLTNHFYAITATNNSNTRCNAILKSTWTPPTLPKKRKKKKTTQDYCRQIICRVTLNVYWLNGLTLFGMGWRQLSRIALPLYSLTRIRQTAYLTMMIKEGSTKSMNVTNPGTGLLGTWCGFIYVI